LELLKPEYTNRFKRQFKKLTAEQQQAVDRKVALLMRDPVDPGLMNKRVRGTRDIWEASVNADIHLTWQRARESGVIILRNVGMRDPALHGPDS